MELFTQIGTLVNAGGVVFLLVAAIVGRYKQWWVDGPTHAEMRDDRDEWKDMALKALGVSEKAADVATKSVLTASQAIRAQRAVRYKSDDDA